MDFRFWKRVTEPIRRRFGFVLSPWQTPPERGIRGFLDAMPNRLYICP